MAGRALEHVRNHVVGYLALFAALGGGTVYAAGQIDSGDIAANAVKAKQLAPRALTQKHGQIRTGRIDIVDPHGGGDTDFTTKKLLDYGPFRLRGECRDLGSYSNKVSITSSQEAFAVGQTDTVDPDTIGETPVYLAPESGSLNANAANPRAITAFTPSGKSISVQVFEVNKAAGDAQDGAPDCSFWVVGTGRK